jgi:hypothetical protein
MQNYSKCNVGTQGKAPLDDEWFDYVTTLENYTVLIDSLQSCGHVRLGECPTLLGQ